MKIHTRLVLIFFLFLGLGLSVWRNLPEIKTAQSQQAMLRINDGSSSQNFDISKYAGKNVLEATQGVTSGKVIMKGTGVNAFVTGLLGREVDDKKHEFWELLVNSEQSQVGAGSYIIKNSDQIEWRINTY